ncbi:MAG: NADPH-dependent FMN reductase [Polyangia bacterium]
MALVVTITGSPAAASRTLQLSQYVNQRLAADGFEVATIDVRTLPAEDLLHARAESEGLRSALASVERADGVIIATPIYKAAYTGLLKAFLDLLPQLALTGKAVLPLATGGTLAHVLAVDYGLRPVLQSLGALHVSQGLFILDKLLGRGDDGSLTIDPEIRARLDALVSDFARATRLHRAPQR